jgi:PTH1 family peptidyl-tRNA hydrolase
VDLPLGDVRLRTNGSPGTHNGLKSIIEQFGQEFPRLRIGVGKQPPGADLAAWILSVPSAAEERSLEDALKKLPDIVHSFVLEGPTNITA